MTFLPLIEAKRDGQTLTADQLKAIISAYTAGQIPDYQMAAFLMAVYFRGLKTAEISALTLAMRDSGDVLKFPKDGRPLVDKHSTGGVGDKISLVLAPLLACLGFRVPMISGRGLGITGGTLDKLDAIPGFKSTLPMERIVETVQKVGCVICGQTERMVPADRGLYALRDVTGTVPSIPLIVASILSKKLAEGLQALVLDVKFGVAAFMPTLEKARELASAMVSLGNECGVSTRALLSRMDSPLGRAAGNWLEVKEAALGLEPKSAARVGQGIPADVLDVVLTCASELLVQTGKINSHETARREAADCLDSGEPRKHFEAMLSAQATDLEQFRRKLELDHTAPVVVELKASSDGYISRCDARIIGETIRELGGGRLTKDSLLNYDVGMDRLAKPGELVKSGCCIGRIHAANSKEAEAACARAAAAFDISPQSHAAQALIEEVI